MYSHVEGTPVPKIKSIRTSEDPNGPYIIVELLYPTNPLDQTDRRARLAGAAFFSGAIFGALLIVGLAWLAWAVGI